MKTPYPGYDVLDRWNSPSYNDRNREVVARRLHGRGFAELEPEAQDATLRAVQKGEGDEELWAGLPAQRFFSDMLLKTVAGVYYTLPSRLERNRIRRSREPAGLRVAAIRSSSAATTRNVGSAAPLSTSG